MKIITNVDSVIADLKRYRDLIAPKVNTLITRLAEVGYNTASIKFALAQYDGDNDVVVDTPQWESDTRMILSASGHAIMFIEFGAGVNWSETHPIAAEVGAIRGQYGAKKGSHPPWEYYGTPGTNGEVVGDGDARGQLIKTYGNPPARAMYDAGKEMRQRILEIAREVWATHD